MKLNIGCFNKKIHGFINVDILEEFKPDVIDDVKLLKKFQNNTIDLIYASHLLEHFYRYETIEVEYLDKNFNKHKQVFTGFPAQIIQHEVDHFEGIII